MTKYLKINTNRKRFAFELIMLISISLFCFVIFAIGEYSENKKWTKYNYEVEKVNLQIDSLKSNYFRGLYSWLEEKEQLNEYSYNSFKKNFLYNQDSSFKKNIYLKICRLDPSYENELTFEDFVNNFDIESIEQIDVKILALENQNVTLVQKRPKSNDDVHLIVIAIILISSYPLRFIYYILKWAFKTLKEKETTNNTQPDEDTLPENNEINLITESQISLSDLRIDNHKKRKLFNIIKLSVKYILIFWALDFIIVFISFYFLGPQPEPIFALSSLLSLLITYKIYKWNYSKIDFSKLSTLPVLILGAFLWALIIGIPQFFMNYSYDLLTGKSNVGVIPFQFYPGLISGVVFNFILWGIVIILKTIYSRITKKTINRNFAFLGFTGIVFMILMLRYTSSMYSIVILDENKVFEAKEMIRDYKSQTEHQYSENVRQNFINSCIKNGGSQQACSCVFEKIERRFPFDEYVKIESEIIAGQMPEYFYNFLSEAKSECNQ